MGPPEWAGEGRRGGPPGDPWDPGEPIPLATLVSSGEEQSPSLPPRLLPVEPLGDPLRTRRFVLNHGMAPGQGMVFLINGRAYDHERVDTRVRLGDTEDWELVNTGVMDHPFHLHVHRFQVISRDGRAEPFLAWRDVVLVKAGETVRIRVAFRDHPGRTVYHCHILDHEELGMMSTLEVEA
jgi:FtsP/CotA-like multicopper oxidase with cupredoxin domain